MPCMDPWPYHDTAHKVHTLTRMLCEWCAHPEQQPLEVAEWWAAHQEADRQRQAAEAAGKRERVARAQRELERALEEMA